MEFLTSYLSCEALVDCTSVSVPTTRFFTKTSIRCGLGRMYISLRPKHPVFNWVSIRLLHQRIYLWLGFMYFYLLARQVEISLWCLRSLLLCLFNLFRALIKSFVCWFKHINNFPPFYILFFCFLFHSFLSFFSRLSGADPVRVTGR